MKSVLILFAVLCLSAAGHAAGKNFLPVSYRSVGGDFERLLSDPSVKWNFNFRPYSKESAAMLFTDPAYQRDVSAGKNIEGQRPTAISMFCDSEGFTLLIFAGEPDMKKYLAEGKAFPSCTLELFFAPGDCDNEEIVHYNQFIISDPIKPEVRFFPWLVNDRNFESLESYLRLESKIVSNGVMLRIFVPWTFAWNMLPLDDGKRNNYWRLSVIRFSPGGGQTWGGVVHELSRAGYIQWPDFTPEQKLAIRKNVLYHAWNDYKAAFRRVDPAKTPDLKEPYRAALPKSERSYNNFAEYRDFAEEWMKPMAAERDALGAQIAAMDTLSPEEQDRFYKKASAALIQFQYDLEEAFAKYLKQKWMSEKE